MPHYLLSVHGTTEQSPYADEAEMAAAFAATDVFNDGLRESGHWVFAGGLHHPDTASVVSIGDNGEAIVTDGPYAEVKEQIGGFWIIEAADLDEALKLAEGGSRACRSPVEVRPFQGLG
jgi:hypothetical protein